MINFYSQEEFEGQMVHVMVTEGLSQLEAYTRVRQQEQQEAQEYQNWLDQQILEDEIYNEFG